MAKRRAEKQLTESNWDEEEPVPEVGVFERASEDVLMKRTIRKAKRSITLQSDDSPNPFAGFSFNRNGSSGSSVSTATVNSNGTTGGSNTRTSDEYLLKVAKLNRDILKFITRIMDTGPYLNLTPCFDDYVKHFQRLTNEEEERQRKNNNNNSISTTASAPSSGGFASSGSNPGTAKATESQDPKPASTLGLQAQTPPSTPPKSNSSDLNPKGSASTFSFGNAAATGVTTIGNSLNSGSGTQSGGSLAKFTFGAPSTTSQSAPTGSTTKSVFGSLSSGTSGGTGALSTLGTANKADTAATFKFGAPLGNFTGNSDNSSVGGTSNPLFSFNSTTGFSFGTAAASVGAPAMGAATQGTEEEDEAPPKVDIAPVEEEGSLYTKKVKLYYKKQETSDSKGQYADKGVGFLHIKKLDGGGYQLLVRAQTTLGNVLLNVRLGKDMPVTNVGKNNVGIICVPNPRLDPKSKDDKPDPPTMFLIRVKTSEDAIELREKLVEFKGSA